jgi:hypothetical protein
MLNVPQTIKSNIYLISLSGGFLCISKNSALVKFNARRMAVIHLRISSQLWNTYIFHFDSPTWTSFLQFSFGSLKSFIGLLVFNYAEHESESLCSRPLHSTYLGMVFVSRRENWHFTAHVYRGMARKLTADGPHVTGGGVITCRLPRGSEGVSRQENALIRPYNCVIVITVRKLIPVLQNWNVAHVSSFALHLFERVSQILNWGIIRNNPL